MIMLVVLFESGPRLRHANFVWTSYSVTFVLMFASLRFLIEQYVQYRESAATDTLAINSRPPWQFSVALLVFSLHVVSGLAYAIRVVGN